MASTADCLKWTTLTGAVNEMKSPNNFLKGLLFGNHNPLPTEDIELSVITKSREIAPFVRKNGEGVMVGGHAERFQNISAPNIRIKRPFTPSELLYNRRPGTVIFSPGASMQLSAIEAHIARDLQVMADMITNAEEYLCAQALQGTITYSQADGDVFTITFPKPAGNNITLSVFWNDATPANVTMLANLHAVKKVMSDEVGLTPTDAILGSEASTAFRAFVAGGHLYGLDINKISMGSVDFNSMYSEQGVIYLGTVAGINFWEYSRTADLAGVSTPMIRAKYAEFISRSSASQRVLYYGAIPDMKALQGRKFQGERFSKAWEIEDPSSWMNLTASRPLPATRRPGAHVSVKVVSG